MSTKRNFCLFRYAGLTPPLVTIQKKKLRGLIKEAEIHILPILSIHLFTAVIC